MSVMLMVKTADRAAVLYLKAMCHYHTATATMLLFKVDQQTEMGFKLHWWSNIESMGRIFTRLDRTIIFEVWNIALC